MQEAKNNLKLSTMRHSLAHIMAAAVQRLYPDAKFGVGPSIEDGFYYDIDLGEKKISEKDFVKIEKMMQKIIKENQRFIRTEKTIEEAIEWAKEKKQDYKLELLNDLKKYGTTNANVISSEIFDDKEIENDIKTVSFYTNGNYQDLCLGPHVDDTSKIGAFKIMKVAGAYWRGNENNPQMQRLYGVAFDSEEELEQYLNKLEEAKKRDHRKLGKELDLYTFSPLVGAGLPLFTPRGTVLRDLLASYSNQLRQEYGFQKVWTPHITKKDLYEKSGHWAKFGEELFLVASQETSDSFALKPMNCPHHTQIYASSPRSYKDLPIRYLETTTDYRDEKTGELGGLNRVRSLTQDDSHIFCRKDQIEVEIQNLLSCANKLYSSIGMNLHVRLSYRDDSDGYLGDKSLWQSAQEQLKKAVISNNLDYFEQEGEAAFYGPKIDFMATDAIGREHQVATVQLDFVQPQRFELTYKDSEAQDETPVMIHCALLGSIERFMSVYIEHRAGWFDFWATPEQIRILPINDKVDSYISEVSAILDNIVINSPIKFNQIRYSIDNKKGSLGKKIRDAVKMKIPVQIIIGGRDMDNKEVSIRIRKNGDFIEESISLSDLEAYIKSI